MGLATSHLLPVSAGARATNEASMKHLVAYMPLVLLICLVLAGCEPPPPVAGNNGPPAPPAPPPPPGAEPTPAVEPTPEAAAPTEPEMERVKAQKGVGIKGRSLDEYEG